jgi:hypothetical protein
MYQVCHLSAVGGSICDWFLVHRMDVWARNISTNKFPVTNVKENNSFNGTFFFLYLLSQSFDHSLLCPSDKNEGYQPLVKSSYQRGYATYN